MAVYKLRVELEDFEVQRDLEIQSRQSIMDLFHAIVNAFGFDDKHLAILYDSDTLFRKNKELAYNDDDLAEKKRCKYFTRARMADFINDPHQHLVMLYDKARRWTFNIELLYIELNEADVPYPRVIRMAGEAPKQYADKHIVAVSDQFSGHEGMEMGVSEEDIAFLEGSEGEEEGGEDDAFSPAADE